MLITKKQILSVLPPPKGVVEVTVDDHDTNDIIRGIVEMHNDNVANYLLVGRLFLENYELEEIPYFLFLFCKNNLKYREDTGESQELKSPQVLMRDGYCDCKGYSLFIGGTLNAINSILKKRVFDCNYCLVSFDNDKLPTHIFVKCNGDNVDPCYWKFSNEIDYTYIYTLKISNNMAVKKISGKRKRTYYIGEGPEGSQYSGPSEGAYASEGSQYSGPSEGAFAEGSEGSEASEGSPKSGGGSGSGSGSGSGGSKAGGGVVAPKKTPPKKSSNTLLYVGGAAVVIAILVFSSKKK